MPMMFGFSGQRRQLLEAELRRIAAELPRLGALRAYLVGALPLGSVDPETELELLVVQPTDEPFHRRADFWVNHLRPRVGTRFLVYTPEELEALADVDPLLREAQRIGEAVIG
ncbi:MAG: hypothetical protein H0V51_04635 [Chloroflexi bacterium]|nr:hypothetical protein [Chloroflexota bacterium]